MEQVNIHHAKTHLSKLIQRALAGEEIIIAKDNVPMVTLAPIQPNQQKKQRRAFNQLKGKMHLAEDFDETSPELLELFGITP